jgi:hypothetical protein
MCDYSLEGYRTRLAKKHENLTAYPFPSCTVGFLNADGHQQIKESGANDELLCAICIPPGARLLLTDIPLHTREAFGVPEAGLVTFTLTSIEPRRHRDGVRFEDGTVVSLQELAGARAQVLSLDSEEQTSLDERRVEQVGQVEMVTA